MDIQQTAQILLMAKTHYHNRSSQDEKGLIGIYYNGLQDLEFEVVIKNFMEHIKVSPYFPMVSDLRNDKSKTTNEGRYVPDVRTTMLEMQQKEQERHLALTTNVTNVYSEQIQAAKEKALKTIANAVKRSEEENPYKVVE